MKKLFFLFVLIIFSLEAFSQKDSRFYFLGGFDISGNSYNYAQHGNVLVTSDPDLSYWILNHHFALQYKYKSTFSIEAGIQLLEFSNLCLDTAYLFRNPQSRTVFLGQALNGNKLTPLGFDNYYTSYYFTLTKYFPFNDYVSFYISGGLNTNHLQHNSLSNGINTFADPFTNETLQFKYSSIHRYYGMTAEAGLNFLLFHQRVSFYNGFRFNTGFRKVIVGDYTDTKGGILLNSDHLSTTGTYMGVVFRAGINLFSADIHNVSLRPPHIKRLHLRFPQIRFPHIAFHLHRNRKEKKSYHYKKHPTVKSPRFILQ